MKKYYATPLFAAAALTALIFGAQARAQDSSPAGSPAVSTSSSSAEGGGHHGHGDRLAKLAADLGLTDQQKEQIKPILQDEGQQIKALKDDPDRKEKVRAIRKDSMEKIKAILTPEQVQKWKELMQERRAKHQGAGNAEGATSPAAVTSPATSPGQ